MNLIGKHQVVSIILPFKNEEKFMEECLNSILIQTYKSWELILVDDHSEDRSQSIAKDYTLKDSRIRYFLNPKSGVIEALKEGFKQSTGSFITRMDGDDIKSIDNLEQLLEVTSKGTVGIGQFKYFKKGGIGDGYRRYTEWLNDLTQKDSNFKDIYKECVIPSPCWMCTRDDFIACGGFNSDLYPEDYDLSFRFYGNNLKTQGTKGIIHFWRDYSNRSSRTSTLYADNRFVELKVLYFLKYDYDNSKTLVLWGAGKKAKKIAKYLVDSGIKFNWITNNSKKINHNIYGVILSDSYNYLPNKNHTIIVAVSEPDGINEIRTQCHESDVSPFWFC